MKEVKLLKKKWGRRRFVKGHSFCAALNWMDELFLLEEKIRHHSGLQKLGQEAFLEVHSGKNECSILVEVVGTPKAGFHLFDLEAQDVFIYEALNSSFLTNFQEVFKLADVIRGHKGLGLADFYHIVVDGAQIELHFFRQKDYIHSEH